MPGTPTPILQLTVPTVGGDANVWGSELNADLVIIDNLGATAIFPVSSNYNAVISVAPETIIRVTTAGLTIAVALPTPALAVGKVFTIKKVDSGLGQVSISATGGSTIDGQATWVLATQFSYVRLVSNGASYDVIGGS